MNELPTNYRPDPLLPSDLEEKRQASVLWLGTRWLLHPDNGPRRGRLVWIDDEKYFQKGVDKS